MNVLQIVNSLQTGGAEMLVHGLCDQLRKRGIHCTILQLMDGPSIVKGRIIASDIEVLTSPCRTVTSPGQIAAIVTRLKLGRYDIVHAHLFPTQLWVAAAKRCVPKRAKFVTTEHSTWNRRRQLPFRTIDRWVYRQYGAVACITEDVEAELTTWVGRDVCRTEVIHNGIALDRFLPIGSLKSFDRIPDDPMYLSVGSLTVGKDHATLLRALARTSRGKLVIAGEGPLRTSLERLRGELGLQDRVTLLGVQEDIAALMAKADVFVHPSIVEGFGLAVVEAMAAGLPVIASDVPGMRRVLGESAVVFRAGDVEALAVCLKRLAEDRNLCASASAAGRNRAAQYGIEKMAASYQLLYERLICDT